MKSPAGTSRAPRSPSRAAGFTLPEATVALLVSALVLAGAYRVFGWVQRQDSRQRLVAATQADLIPVQRNLERTVRRAGVGIPMQTRTLDSAGRLVQVGAVELRSGDDGQPQGLVVRGNFSGIRTQARETVPVAGTWIRVQEGGEAGFAVGDRLALIAGELSEFVFVTGVDAGGGALSTTPRTRDYPAGTSVIRVSEVRIVAQGRDTLGYLENGRLHVLTPHLEGFDLALRDFRGAVDSVPPFEPAEAKSLLYRLRVAVPGGAADTVRRAVSGEVSFRNGRS